MNDIKIVTISGSMRYAKHMLKIAHDLQLRYGYAVIQCAYNFNGYRYNDVELEKLNKIHYKKIDICDILYVVNIDSYIGNSTRQEIEYAKKNNKQIIYHIQEEAKNENL